MRSGDTYNTNDYAFAAINDIRRCLAATYDLVNRIRISIRDF